MRSIVTICNKSYSILLPYWLDKIRAITDLPVQVLVFNDVEKNLSLKCSYQEINTDGNPFPNDKPDFACFEKMRIFKHLPKDINEILFIDIDAMVLNDFWTKESYFEKSRESWMGCKDFFVGYKEKMEEEFQIYDPDFKMKYYDDGTFFYFNTGVFFASREKHEELFNKFTGTWIDYVTKTGKYPSIFDQNMFNYCFIRYDTQIIPMPTENNCIRQYNPEIKDGRLYLKDKLVNVMHFNGGEAEIKLNRWKELAGKLK